LKALKKVSIALCVTIQIVFAVHLERGLYDAKIRLGPRIEIILSSLHPIVSFCPLALRELAGWVSRFLSSSAEPADTQGGCCPVVLTKKAKCTESRGHGWFNQLEDIGY